MKSVGTIRDIPPRPKAKLGPGLGNIDAVNKREKVNNGIVHEMNLKSFLKNGMAKKNIPSGISTN